MVTFQRTIRFFHIIAILVLFGSISIANAKSEKESGKEQRLTQKDLPSAVIAAFQKQYPGAKIKGISKEVENDTAYFEIESSDSTSRRTVLYAVDGQRTEIEEIISAKQLPDLARAEISKTYSKGKIEAAERVTKGQTTTYEVKIENGEENIEAVFDSTGKLLNSEKLKAEEDND